MEKTASSTHVVGKTLDICLKKTETRSMFVPLYKYKLNLETSTEKCRGYTGSNRNRQGLLQ
jgi:hypothetical protein